MPGGAVVSPAGSVDDRRVEAPVTLKTYLMCAFAAFGGIFFGYDSGYISGVLGMDYFITTFEHLVSTGIAIITFLSLYTDQFSNRTPPWLLPTPTLSSFPPGRSLSSSLFSLLVLSSVL